MMRYQFQGSGAKPRVLAEREKRIEKRLQAAQRSIHRGRLKAGARKCLEIVRENPEDPWILNRAGDLLVRAREADSAISCFFRVARAYAGDRKVKKAIAIYKKILRLDPGASEAYDQLAELYRKSGQPAEAQNFRQRSALQGLAGAQWAAYGGLQCRHVTGS